MSNLVLTSKSNMLILTETWLSDHISDSEVLTDLPNFSLFRADRPNARGGGVLIAASQELSCSVLSIRSNLELLFIHCHAAPQSVLVGVCYRPPHSSPAFAIELNNALFEITSKHTKASLLLFGDFNFPDINWHNLSPHLVNETEVKNFLDVCLDFNLSQLVSQPTRITENTANVLDLILTNQPDKLSSIAYLKEISDHKVIHASFNFGAVPRLKVQKTIHLYKKANYKAMYDNLCEFLASFETSFNKRTIHTNWQIFKEKINSLADRYIPRIAIGTQPEKPWFSNSLKRLDNKKKRLYRAAKGTTNVCAWDKYYTAERAYLSAVREAKKTYFHEDLPKMLVNNPRKFWQVINPRDINSNTLINEDGETVDDVECANIFNAAFASVFTKEVSLPFPSTASSTPNTMPVITFHVDGISSLIDNLKLSSSAGVDNINSKVLKNTKDISAAYLCLLFSQSLSTGTIPHDWTVGRVVPIYKSGDKNSPLNYRPISLTSVPCKIMEHVIYTEIMKFLDSNKYFHPSQHGFRKGFSCETQLAAFLHDLHTNLDTNLQTDAIFLDFAKAFDKVPHQRLLLKLSLANVHPDVLRWIEAFLNNRSQFVFINNSTSDSLRVTSGVPQGSVLGPLLFLIYINDLPGHVTCNIRMFADDCVIYKTITNTSHQISLQANINRLQQWCDCWLMTLNPAKCKVVTFSRRRNPLSYSYSINNISLEASPSYKYLGVTLTKDLSWNAHITNVISSSNKSLGFLKRHLKQAPKHVRLLAYQTIIRPKLEYACAVWSPHQTYLSNALETVQNRAVRFIHSQYSYHVSVSLLRKDLGLPTLASRRRVLSLSLFHKFYHCSLNQTPYIIPPGRTSHRTGHINHVGRPRTRTTTFSGSFFLRTAIDWNSLPHQIAALTSAPAFMQEISHHFSE